MRAMRLLPLLLALACQDYGFTPDEDPDSPPDTDEWVEETGDTDLPDEDCEDQTIPGFAAPINEDCENEVETGTFNPVVEWRKPNWSIASGSNWIMSHPIVVQLTDDNADGTINVDDTPDIVVVTFQGGGTYLRATSGDGSVEHWSVPTSLQITTGPAAADLDGDGLVEIIALTANGIACYEHDGTLKWQRDGILSTHIQGTSDVASITDMDGDGVPEIIAGRAILDNNGNLIAAGAYGRAGVQDYGNVATASFAVDVDGDGTQEVVVGNALYRKDGSAIWYNGEGDGYPAVADFDGDGQGEIVVSGGGQVRLQDTDGTVLWNVPIPGATTRYYGGPPTVADFDGDGEPEIGVAAGSRYSVIEADGSVLWQAVTNDSSSGNTGSTVFDFEGDGVAEVVYADQTSLWVFNGIDGAVKLQFTEHSNGTWLEYPVVADVDGDDNAEIIVPHTPQNGSFTGFTVIGDRDSSWRKGLSIWNQHAFHITNINEDGTVPADADLNWLSYNNFRSSDVSGNYGLAAPDLKVDRADICEIDCDEGELWVWVHVGNEGAAPVENAELKVTITEQGADRDVTVSPYGLLEEGLYQDAELFRLEADDWAQVSRITFEVQGDDLECNPDNNVHIIEGPFCR